MLQRLSCLMVLLSCWVLSSCGLSSSPEFLPTPPSGFTNLDSLVTERFLQQVSFSSDGNLLAALGGKLPEESNILQLYIINRKTNRVLFSGTEELWQSLALSSTGDQIAACGNLSDRESIYIINWRSNITSFLTDGCYPAWSPDDKSLAFVYYTTQRTSIERHAQIRIRELATNEERVIYDVLSPNGFIGELVWSPTGDKLAFTMTQHVLEGEERRVPKLYTINVNGSDLTMVTKETEYVVTPNFSPDGTKLLYAEWSKRSEDLRVSGLDGQCHGLEILVKYPSRVKLSPDGNIIAIKTPSSMLVAESRDVLSAEFWESGTPCLDS